jgi:D-alanyl-D-alanine-carboxypeptidase/D-alanyl-D-alanine-endopeptidase
MTVARLRRSVLLAAVAFAAALPPALAADKQLEEATAFTGTIIALGSNVPGLIFGAVRGGETSLVGFGETRDGSGKVPDEDSIFRIASVSKVFCGTVLSAMAIDGLLGVTDPLQAYAGEGVTVPEKDGRTMRLIDLVTQASGLPREVPRPDSPENDPFASNTRELAFAELLNDPFLYAPGTAVAYSNWGYDLLGAALATAGGSPYADQLRDRFLDGLGMDGTVFNPPADAGENLMEGHFFDGSPMPNVPTPAGIECAGGLHTTGADMLKWIAWNVDADGDTMRELRRVTQAAYLYRDGLASVVGIDDAGPMAAMSLGGWVIQMPDGNKPLILEKTGGLQGFFTYVAIAPTRGVGAFFVMNQFNAGAFGAAVQRTNDFVASLAPR